MRQAQAEGVDSSIEDAQKLIDTFYGRFPRTKDFFDKCHEAVLDPGWVANAFGRRRYFPVTHEKSKVAEQQRQAGNMPIQGTVGDALTIALYNLYRYREIKGMKYKIVLTIHDAAVLAVPVDEVQEVKEVVLPVCMQFGAKIPNIGLELGIDIGIMRRWDVKISEEQAVEEARQELLVA